MSRPSSLMPVTTREVERIAQEMAAHLAQQAALGRVRRQNQPLPVALHPKICAPATHQAGAHGAPHPLLSPSPPTAGPPRLAANTYYIVPSALPCLWSMHPVIPPG